jgi:hypothetical protein
MPMLAFSISDASLAPSPINTISRSSKFDATVILSIILFTLIPSAETDASEEKPINSCLSSQGLI